jgi:CRP/FNR family cyclic AMP-dependent transcriptional regulator
MLRRSGRNRFIGELGVFTDLPRIATVVARTYLVVLRIDRDSLMSLAAEFPSVGVEIISELGRRQHSTNRSLAYLTRWRATSLTKQCSPN